MTTLAVSRQDLLDGLRTAGIVPGDLVYVASSLAALGMMDDPVADTLWALRESVGEDGTIVMPAFNFAFCDGGAFDPRQTPSDCGTLTEAFRNSPGVIRTVTPPYHTVAALGPHAHAIGRIQSSTSFGGDSVFEYLHDEGAKQLLIGCGFDEGVAHVHWLEERHAVPYRYWKKFDGEVIQGGQRRRASFFMYARRLDMHVELDAEPLARSFENTGRVQTATVGVCRIRSFSLQDLSVFADPLFAQNPLLLLKPECLEQFVHAPSPVKRIDHIGVVSPYADAIRELLRVAGCELSHEGRVNDLGVRCTYFSGLGPKVELVDATEDHSVIDGHLRQHAASPLHHLALEVDSLSEGIEYFRAHGYAPLDGRCHLVPKPGQRVMFLSPITTGGLLVELVANGTTDHQAGDIHGH